MRFSRLWYIPVAAALSVTLFACDREERGFRVQPPAAETMTTVRLSDLQPGATQPATLPAFQASAPPSTRPSTQSTAQASATQPASQPASTQTVVDRPATQALVAMPRASVAPPAAPVQNPYEQNAYHLAEGKRLYAAYNCKGCHADGGGNIGPPLMDDSWIYGSNPEQVFATIVQGRPNGMPSFMGRIPDYQVWQIAAYVRSMSGLVRKDAAPGRTDHMQVKKPENSTDAEQPKNSALPKSAEMPQ